MRVAHDDLILSTQGRSFWIMDDITPLREVESAIAAGTHLFAPRDVRRLTNLGVAGMSELNPDPPPAGAQIHYYLAEEPDEDIRVEVVDPVGDVVRTFSSDSATAADADGEQIAKSAGLNRIAWALQYEGPELPEGAVQWGYTGGVTAPPGTYTVRLTVGDTMAERAFELLPDPRIPEVTVASYQQQFRVAMLARDSINSITRAIDDLAAIRAQVEEVMERARSAEQADDLQALADTLNDKSTGVTEDLMQTKNRSGQDPIRFPPRLDNQWIELYGRVTGTDGYISGGAEGAPQQGTMERLDDLLEEWDTVRTRYVDLLENELRRFNEAVELLGLPAVVLPRRGRIVS